MAWEGSNRRAELPPNWGHLRRVILTRCGERCEAIMRNGTRCHDKATEVDHITPGNNHDPANLQGLCSWHHARKTAQEGNAARSRPPTLRRPAEPHPGSL